VGELTQEESGESTDKGDLACARWGESEVERD